MLFFISTVIGGLMLVAILLLITKKNPGERVNGSTPDWRKKLEGQNVSMPPWDLLFPKKKPRDRR